MSPSISDSNRGHQKNVNSKISLIFKSRSPPPSPYLPSSLSFSPLPRRASKVINAFQGSKPGRNWHPWGPRRFRFSEQWLVQNEKITRLEWVFPIFVLGGGHFVEFILRIISKREFIRTRRRRANLYDRIFPTIIGNAFEYKTKKKKKDEKKKKKSQEWRFVHRKLFNGDVGARVTINNGNRLSHVTVYSYAKIKPKKKILIIISNFFDSGFFNNDRFELIFFQFQLKIIKPI